MGNFGLAIEKRQYPGLQLTRRHHGIASFSSTQMKCLFFRVLMIAGILPASRWGRHSGVDSEPGEDIAVYNEPASHDRHKDKYLSH